MSNRKRAPYTKEEGKRILDRVKNQLTLEQAERTRKRVEELNRLAQTQRKGNANTAVYPGRDTQLSALTSSSTEESTNINQNLEPPSYEDLELPS